MAYSDDIKTIAKTKQLEDKINKALRSAEQAKKESIETKRISIDQNGGTQVGSNGGGATSNGTNASGDNVLPPLAPPPKPPDDSNSSNSSGDSYNNSLNESSIDASAFTQNNNLAGNGSLLNPNAETNSFAGGGASRTDKIGQADHDLATASAEKKAEWDAVTSSDWYIGLSTDKKDAFARKFWATEKGTHEVGAVYKGEEGPKPAPGKWTSFAPSSNNANNNGLHTLVIPIVEKLNSIVGVDPDNETLAMEIRFDGKSILPSLQESINAGQAQWTSITDAPIISSYVQGSYWTIVGGYLGDTIVGQTFEEILSARSAIGPTKAYGLDGGSGSALVTTLSPTYTEDFILFSGNFGGMVGNTAGSLGGTIYARQATPGVVSSGEYGTKECTGSAYENELVCTLDPPRESQWPPVGLYVLNFFNLGFLYSVFDSEVPLKYKGHSNTIRIKSAYTGDSYDIEPAIDGGFLISNATGGDGYFLYYGSDRSLRAIVPNGQYNFYKPRGD